MTNVVAVRDLSHGLALVASFARLALLVRGQLRFPSHLHPARNGTGSTFSGADADQLALELGQARLAR